MVFPEGSGCKDLPVLWGGIPACLQHSMGAVSWSRDELLVPDLGLLNSPQICETVLKFECRILVVSFS